MVHAYTVIQFLCPWANADWDSADEHVVLFVLHIRDIFSVHMVQCRVSVSVSLTLTWWALAAGKDDRLSHTR